MAWLALVVVVLLLVAAVRACGGSAYPSQAAELAAHNAELGREFVSLRSRLGSLGRVELFRRLKGWSRTAAEHVEASRALEPPGEYRVAHGYLVAALGLRAEALKRFEPAVLNVLSDRDAQVVASQLGGVMSDLASADRAWTLMREGWPAREDVPQASRWVLDGQESAEGVTALVAELRNQPALEAIYNLRVTDVRVAPKATGKDGGLDVLPASSSLTVTVVVENAGNQRVPAATVDAVLTSESDPEPRTATGRLSGLEPGAKDTVVLRGLVPTRGVINLLSVTVGPVGGEKNLIDNRTELKFLVARN